MLWGMIVLEVSVVIEQNYIKIIYFDTILLYVTLFIYIFSMNLFYVVEINVQVFFDYNIIYIIMCLIISAILRH